MLDLQILMVFLFVVLSVIASVMVVAYTGQIVWHRFRLWTESRAKKLHIHSTRRTARSLISWRLFGTTTILLFFVCVLASKPWASADIANTIIMKILPGAVVSIVVSLMVMTLFEAIDRLSMCLRSIYITETGIYLFGPVRQEVAGGISLPLMASYVKIKEIDSLYCDVELLMVCTFGNGRIMMVVDPADVVPLLERIDAAARDDAGLCSCSELERGVVDVPRNPAPRILNGKKTGCDNDTDALMQKIR